MVVKSGGRDMRDSSRDSLRKLSRVMTCGAVLLLFLSSNLQRLITTARDEIRTTAATNPASIYLTGMVTEADKISGSFFVVVVFVVVVGVVVVVTVVFVAVVVVVGDVAAVVAVAVVVVAVVAAAVVAAAVVASAVGVVAAVVAVVVVAVVVVVVEIIAVVFGQRT